MRLILCTLMFLACGFGEVVGNTKTVGMAGPGGELKVVIGSTEEGALWYACDWKGNRVIEESPLGLTVDGVAWGEGGVEVFEVSGEVVEDEWEMLWGEQKKVKSVYSDNAVRVKKISGDRAGEEMIVRVRIFEDGFGFRYEVEGSAADGKVVASNERTRFMFDGDYTSWGFVRMGMQAISGKPISEMKMVRQTKRGAREVKVTTPVIVKKADNVWVAIHEAGLDGYGPCFVKSVADDGLYGFVADIGGGEVTGLGKQIVTPWRVVLVGDEAGDLVTSNVILNLNEKPASEMDFSWVKPSKLIWDWRGRGAKVEGWDYDLNTETCIRYVDAAKRLGLDGFMIDAGWYHPKKVKDMPPADWWKTGPVDMPKIAKYAEESGVDLWLYFNHPELSRYETEKVFENLKAWGVDGIKNGFLYDANQKNVSADMQMLEMARKYQIMYDVHEPIKPTGLRRKWPHYVGREFVHALADGARMATPEYHATAAFISGIAGPVDQTPGIVALEGSTERRYVRKEIQSTAAAQIARCVVYFTGVLNLSDVPEAYEARMDLFEFVQKLPMKWDESRVLSGEPGDYIVVARRSGDEWFIGALTDEVAREVAIDVSKLGADEYTARIYGDADDANFQTNRNPYQVYDAEVVVGGKLKIKLAPGGGASVWIKPKE
ncbi:glycoside hydrolase family 97 catalytic domain-containing protein [Poriferisphaera sp. WC338]|uniref:glycoside hydrolase family 97 protein n=1 Tax=Poriferisphaera sp. WC338 TaxID=3425129 RepID=UPI003D813084